MLLTESSLWQRSTFSLGWPTELPSASHLRFGLEVTALHRENILQLLQRLVVNVHIQKSFGGKKKKKSHLEMCR